jgi:DNA polymerase IV 2
MFKESGVAKTEERVILHCDLNNFFASVSLLFNPTLRSVPVAVCGDKEQRHGIVLAKNEAAKRCGVKTAEAIFEARAKCPELVILPPMMDKYKEYSEKAHRIYEEYTDMIEPFGIDECWLDVTGSRLLFGSGEEIADKIRREIKQKLGITVSVGVSFNKVFAKLGSDMKKPDGITVISRENFREKIWRLPISDLLFVGRKTTDRLRSCGICTIGDAAVCSDEMLERLLGKNGLELKRYALGEDNSPVSRQHEKATPKSIGRSVTRQQDFKTPDEIWGMFLSLAREISDSLREQGLYAGGVQVHIRNAALSVKEFSRSYPDSVNGAKIIAERGMELLNEHFGFTEPLRSVGLRAINLRGYQTAIQEDIFGDSEKRETEEKIESSIYELRKKFGSTSITRAAEDKK